MGEKKSGRIVHSKNSERFMSIKLSNKYLIDPELLQNVSEESQVVVHCELTAWKEKIWGRVWPTTYLVDNETHLKYPLVHVEGISLYPVWTPIEMGETLRFSLFFKGLPKSCKSFDLIELIPEPGGFIFPGIARNRFDVYYVKF